MRTLYHAPLAFTLVLAGLAHGADVSQEDAAKALRKAVDYFRTTVSVEGGYLWQYAADFSAQEGEVPASPTTVWVQPPGTPSVGLTYLAIYELTGDPYYLEAATETAHALVKGQLQSGGWDYRIEFDPKVREKYAYRADGRTEGRNTTTLDDNTTQAALRCLMRVDQALGFKDATIHEAAEYALKKLMETQYPNGAWPQRFSAPPDPAKHPVMAASYPEDWPKTYPGVDYRSFYTLNDNTQSDLIDLMFRAAQIYDSAVYAASARKGGDFLILAQMPDPQPGWAQQYNAEMHPAWARRFEPASITGGESQGAMQTLLRVFELTGDPKYLEPIPRAVAYYRSSLLDDGRLARFYELKTNKPLYFVKDTYEVTYSDANMPTHYSFKQGSRLDAIEAQYKKLAAMEKDDWKPLQLIHPAKPGALSDSLAQKAGTLVEALNDDGAWVEPGRKTSQGKIPPGTPSLYTRTFVQNIRTLAEFVAAE